MSKNKYTIIINTYPGKERPEQITMLLDSLFAQKYKNFEILIVENYKDQKKLKPLLRKYKNQKQNINVINHPIKKLSYLFDIGWRNAQTEHLAYIADDVVAEPEWLLELDKELTKSKKTAVVTGPLISTFYPVGEMHRLYLISQKNLLFKILTWPYLHFAMEDDVLKPANLFESGAFSLGQGLPESRNFKRQKVDLATTTAMGIKRSVLKQVDGFDYRFNFNHADGDLFIRIRKLGFNIIFNPKMVAHHHVRIGLTRNAYIMGIDTGMYYRKHVRPSSFGGKLGALLNILVFNSYWVYNFIRSKDKSQLNGIYGFIKGLFVSY